MYYLIREFAPKNGESDDDLFDLLYGVIQSKNLGTRLADEIEREDGETNRGN